MSTPKVHHVAQSGFGEGTNSLYDKSRPSYPIEQLSYIKSALSSPEGPLNIIEVGSGTGIFTRALLGHPAFSEAVKELRAIEPSSGMRTQFASTVQDPRVSCEEGTFETTGAPDGWADAVIVAQAWHWCPDFDKALAEFARVLKPDGTVVLVWNLEDNGTPWVKTTRDLYERYEKGTPQFRLGLWRKTFEVPTYAKHFKEPDEHTILYTIPTTLSAVIDRVCSKSYIAILPSEEKAKLVAAIEENAIKGEGRVWIDEQEGIWEYPYSNLAVVFRKSG